MEFLTAVMEHARDFVGRTICHFTELEERVLRNFFSNISRRVFFMHSLPANVAATLSSMYSRIKNPRGLRGVFVDSFIPEFLTCFMKEFGEEGNPAKFLKERGLNSLDKFYNFSKETAFLVEEFLNSVHIDPAYLKKLADSRKCRGFLGTYLDAYGHNSIARKGAVEICFEQISILAAKSVEWGRPGAGYIELSTRYVDMSGKNCYPIEEELAFYGVSRELVRNVLDLSFRHYREQQGEDFSGPFPTFLRENYGHLFQDNPRDLETGVIGETCDVLGNFLPAATLTSVSATVSGEALPELLKHLILDSTPENLALVEAILAEASEVGASQFIRHYEPTDWKRQSWFYLGLKEFSSRSKDGPIIEAELLDNELVEGILVRAFRCADWYGACFDMREVLKWLREFPRKEHDKLPNQFERISATFAGIMSFRGWRDLHRQGFCTHLRTYLTPYLGFYKYDKAAPESFFNACHAINLANRMLLSSTPGVVDTPLELKQYPLALGNLIGFEVSGNLLQWEFCNWQRTKFSVNHEVRQVFLGIERKLREKYPWWSELSRADITPAYVFARGSKGIPYVKD